MSATSRRAAQTILERYFGRVSFREITPFRPALGCSDNIASEFLHDPGDSSTIAAYLEWGSGASTLAMCRLLRGFAGARITTVESSFSFYVQFLPMLIRELLDAGSNVTVEIRSVRKRYGRSLRAALASGNVVRMLDWIFSRESNTPHRNLWPMGRPLSRSLRVTIGNMSWRLLRPVRALSSCLAGHLVGTLDREPDRVILSADGRNMMERWAELAGALKPWRNVEAIVRADGMTVFALYSGATSIAPYSGSLDGEFFDLIDLGWSQTRGPWNRAFVDGAVRNACVNWLVRTRSLAPGGRILVHDWALARPWHDRLVCDVEAWGFKARVLDGDNRRAGAELWSEEVNPNAFRAFVIRAPEGYRIPGEGLLIEASSGAAR